MLSRSSQSQIGSKASSTTWVPLKALPDVEIIEIELIVAEFLSDSVNLGSNPGPPATNRPDIVSYFTFPREPALLTPFRNPVNDSRCLVVARREAAGKRAPTPPVILG
jgi:hypothetical protein